MIVLSKKKFNEFSSIRTFVINNVEKLTVKVNEAIASQDSEKA